MLTHVKGDLFSSAKTHILVIPVNCRGAAGCGLALSAKQRFPGWYESYLLQCSSLSSGLLALSESQDGTIFLNFPTKQDWRAPSTLSQIEQGLKVLLAQSHLNGLSYAFPKLGCGAGQLSWRQVKPLMERYLTQMSGDLLLYE